MADVRNQQFADDIHDDLEALMTTLVTESVAYDPLLSYEYDRHKVGKLQLNAVTVDFDSGSAELTGADVANRVIWQLQYSLRVHTGYAGDTIDGRTTQRLMADVCVQICENWKLTTVGAFIQSIDSVQNGMTFDDSETVGGEITITVMFDTSYTQD
jgi:hypothetical protein